MKNDSIAIVGIGCRFPGADSPEKFWEILLKGENQITTIPKNRKLLSRCVDGKTDEKNRIPDYGGFIDSMEMFDASFFRFSPREACLTDPQHRLMMHVTYEALEDACIDHNTLKGKYVPIYLGIQSSDYHKVVLADPVNFDLYSYVNTSFCALSGRVSHFFDWSGQAVSLDTACSSSLVSLHLACQALISEKAEVALSGGANLLILPEFSQAFTRAGMLSENGRCHAFSAKANGFVRSEGVAVVVLKTLSAAVRDGNPVYATIVATHLNHDGGQGQYKTPNRQRQAKLLRDIYELNDLDPHETQFIEAHGTGTKAGDPVEVGAIIDVVCENRTKENPLFLGSVKTIIGHCEAAAGMAALIKVALAIKNRKIPRNLHFEEPNPNVDWENLPIIVPTETVEWPLEKDKRARGGVSAFGLTGVNAHVILEEAPDIEQENESNNNNKSTLWLLSASTREKIFKFAEKLDNKLKNDSFSISDIGKSLALGRAHQSYRAGIWGSSIEEIREELRILSKGEMSPCSVVDKANGAAPSVCFVFPGQGGQWHGMGNTLYEQFSIYRNTLDDVSEKILIESGFSPVEELRRNKTDSKLGNFSIVQPTTFAVQIALAKLWLSFGIKPRAVIGHSMGEVAAAHIAGILTLDDAVKVICRRSVLIQSIEDSGAMLAVGLSRDESLKLVNKAPDKISLGVCNGPNLQVLSGDEMYLKNLSEELDTKGVFCRFVNVDVASHSQKMEPVKERLLEQLKDVKGQKIDITFQSTVRPFFGRRAEDAELFNADYWWENLRNTVLFADSVESIIQFGIDIFVEVNPHPILSQAIMQSPSKTPRLSAVPSMRRGEDEGLILLRSIADLFTKGVNMDLSSLYRGASFVNLPTTPFNEDKYPIDYETYTRVKSRFQGEQPHPFVISEIRPAEAPDDARWVAKLAPNEQPLWEGHVVQGEIVFPGAGYIDLALTLGRKLLGNGIIEVSSFSFEKTLFLSKEYDVDLQIIATRVSENTYDFDFYNSRDNTRNATGQVVKPTETEDTSRSHDTDAEISSWCTCYDAKEEFYNRLSDIGLNYENEFKRVESVYYGSSLGKVELDKKQIGAKGFAAHPAILDTCFQAGFSAAGALREGNLSLYLPTGIKSIKLFSDHLEKAHTILVKNFGENEADFNVSFYIKAKNGKLLAKVEGFTAASLGRSSVKESETADSLWEQVWIESDIQVPPTSKALAIRDKKWLVRVDSNIGNKVADLLEQQGCTVWRVQRSLRASDTFTEIAPDSFLIRSSSAEDLHMLLNTLKVKKREFDILDFWPVMETTQESATAEQVAKSVKRICIPSLILTQVLSSRGLSPNIYMFTKDVFTSKRGSTAISSTQHSLWGFARVLRVEHPDFNCRVIDIEENEKIAKAIFEEIVSESIEHEVSLRYENRVIRQVARIVPAKKDIEYKRLDSIDKDEETPYRLEWSDDGLLKVAPASTAPAWKEDTIVSVKGAAVYIAGSKEKTVAGRRSSIIGGTVLDSDNPNIRKGEHVLHIGAFRTISSREILSSDELWRLPNYVYLPDALISAEPYLTAFHSLMNIASLSPRDRVLIIAPMNIALASAHLARWARAEVIVVTSEENIPEFHRAGFRNVFDPHNKESKSVLGQIFKARMADVLMINDIEPTAFNPTEFLSDSGRCVWLSTHNNARLPTIVGNQSISSVNISLSISQRDRTVVETWNKLKELLLNGTLPWLISTTVRLTDAIHNRDFIENNEEAVVIFEKIDVASTSASIVRPDASYLVVGGTGGLGLTVSKKLIELGARYIILTSRRVPTAKAEREIVKLRQDGAEIVTLQGDIADIGDLQKILDYIDSSLPPLAGIIHSAAILDDGIILNQNSEKFMKVMPPKVQGAWNLHKMTKGMNLDLFVLFSSAAGLLGSPGQSNYSAANTFLDGLVLARRADGLAAQAIQWGPWSEVGLASTEERSGRLSSIGLLSFSPSEGADVFSKITKRPESILAGMNFDSGRWRAANVGADSDSRYANLEKAKKATNPAKKITAKQLAIKEVSKKSSSSDTLEELRTMAAAILRVQASKLDMNSNIANLGFDSLMMVELRTAINEKFSVDIPVSKIIIGATLKQLSEEIGANEEETTKKIEELQEKDQTLDFSNDEVIEELLRDASKILRVSENKIDTNSSLDSLGFDSLMMMELRSAIHSEFDVDIPVSMMIRGVSLDEIAEKVSSRKRADSIAEVTDEELMVLDSKLLEDLIPTRTPSLLKPKHIFLTGATGFLGRYLLAELIKSDAKKITCLVRAADNEQGMNRLNEVLKSIDEKLDSSKVEILTGDLSKPKLGHDKEYNNLFKTVDSIILNGASVDPFQSYAELRSANVLSFIEILEQSRDRVPAIHLVTSWSVFSCHENGGKKITEQDYPLTAPTGGYRQTKFVAEMIAKEARKRGFPVQVHRPALIGSHSQTGASNRKDLFYALVSAVRKSMIAPDIDMMVPMVPVDLVAYGMCQAISRNIICDHAFHWCCLEPLSWKELIEWMERYGQIKKLPYSMWHRKMCSNYEYAEFLPFMQVIPSNLNNEDFGYIEARLKGQLPEPFENNRTVGRFTSIGLDRTITPDSLSRFIENI